MKTTTEKDFEHLINKMFEIAGHSVSYSDVLGKDQWFLNWTMSESQYDEWKKYVIEYLRKTLKFPKRLAEREAMWFCMNYGLKFDKNPYDEQI